MQQVPVVRMVQKQLRAMSLHGRLEVPSCRPPLAVLEDGPLQMRGQINIRPLPHAIDRPTDRPTGGPLSRTMIRPLRKCGRVEVAQSRIDPLISMLPRCCVWPKGGACASSPRAAAGKPARVSAAAGILHSGHPRLNELISSVGIGV